MYKPRHAAPGSHMRAWIATAAISAIWLTIGFIIGFGVEFILEASGVVHP